MSNGSTLFQKQNAKIPHLVQSGGGLAGEVADLRKDLDDELAPIAPITVDDFTDAATADIDAIKAAFASVATPVTYSGAELDGVVGEDAMPIPRNITVTTGAGGTPGDAPATVTVTGTFQGKAQSEVITVSQTAATAAGLKPFDKVTSLAFAAGDGTGATLEVGFGAGLGVAKTPKARSAATALPFRELLNGAAAASPGTLSIAKLYVPNTAPNGTNDYAVYYEWDPAA